MLICLNFNIKCNYQSGLVFPVHYNLPVPNLEKKIFSVNEWPKDYSGKAAIVKKIIKGVLDQHKLRIHYQSISKTNQTKHENFKAYSLIQYRYGLYVIGNSEDKGSDIIKLALDRIQSVEVRGEKFHYPSGYSPENYLSEGFGIIKKEKKYIVELTFTKEVATIVRERKYHKTARFEDQKNGSVKLFMILESIEQLLPWALSFGTKVTVIKPKELKDCLINEIKALSIQYKI